MSSLFTNVSTDLETQLQKANAAHFFYWLLTVAESHADFQRLHRLLPPNLQLVPNDLEALTRNLILLHQRLPEMKHSLSDEQALYHLGRLGATVNLGAYYMRWLAERIAWNGYRDYDRVLHGRANHGIGDKWLPVHPTHNRCSTAQVPAARIRIADTDLACWCWMPSPASGLVDNSASCDISIHIRPEDLDAKNVQKLTVGLGRPLRDSDDPELHLSHFVQVIKSIEIDEENNWRPMREFDSVLVSALQDLGVLAISFSF